MLLTCTSEFVIGSVIAAAIAGALIYRGASGIIAYYWQRRRTPSQ